MRISLQISAIIFGPSRCGSNERIDFPSRRFLWNGLRAFALWPVLSLLVGVAISAEPENAVAQKVIKALGGLEKLQTVQVVRTSANNMNFGTMNTTSAGGPPLHLSDNQDVVLWEPLTQRFKVHSRLSALVPFPGGFDFEEAFDGTYGSRSGLKDFRPGKGPALPDVFLGARLKRLWLDHPQWLFLKATKVTPAGERWIDDKPMPVLNLIALDESWEMSIDPETFLPHSLTVVEEDGLEGKVLILVRYGDWRDVNGIMVPFRIEEITGGSISRREIRRDVEVSFEKPPDVFRLGNKAALAEPVKADVTWGWNMAHWFLGRYAMGRSSETRSVTPIKLTEIGKGVFHLTGTSHHNLIIVGPESLTVVDAPFYPARSKAVLAKLKERWPEKPVGHLILTHHHTDHVGGMRTYIEAGAQLVVADRNEQYFADILERNGILKADILLISNLQTLEGFGRPVQLLPVPNSHAFDMLSVFLPDEKLLYATDLYSPGRPKQPAALPGELLHAIRFNGLDVERLIGGHGGAPDPISRLEESAR